MTEKYLLAAGLSILVYDLLLTFPAELALIWRPRRFSFPKAAYVINRYGAVALLATFMSGVFIEQVGMKPIILNSNRDD